MEQQIENVSPYPRVFVPSTSVANGRYCKGNGDFWYVPKLIEAAKDLPVFDLPLCALYIGVQPWDLEDIADFAYHAKRALDTDLAHPVLLNPNGYIVDGWHRVVRALIEGKPTIKAKRFEDFPPPDGNEKPPEKPNK